MKAAPILVCGIFIEEIIPTKDKPADALDPAAVRGGRFSELFEFRKPKQEPFLRWFGAGCPQKSGTPFNEGFTHEVVAMHLLGLAPADIQDKLQQAVNPAVGRNMSNDGHKEVKLEDLIVVL